MSGADTGAADLEYRRAAPRDAGAAVAEFLRHGSPRALLLAVALAWWLRLSVGEFGPADAVVAIAILAAWPLNEWLIHVFILHLRPRRIGPLLFDLGVARDHRRHHASPWNLRWVFIPGYVFVPALALMVLAAWPLPGLGLSVTAVTVYLTLALHYEWCHYLAHVDWCPPLPYYRRRVREHRLHHFRNHAQWWGVSMGAADRWFGTAPSPASAPKRIGPLPAGASGSADLT